MWVVIGADYSVGLRVRYLGAYRERAEAERAVREQWFLTQYGVTSEADYREYEGMRAWVTADLLIAEKLPSAYEDGLYMGDGDIVMRICEGEVE